MANHAHTLSDGTAPIEVDAAAFDGLDIDEINKKASSLREISKTYGRVVMLRVASGLSLPDALKLGSSFRPTSSR